MADAFIENQFQVWIDRDKTSSGDLYFAMDNFDVVLLIISKSYLNCSDCQREARYAFEQNMNIVVVNVNQSFVPDKWKAQVIGGKNYLMLSDSKKFTSANYEDIIDKIFQLIQKKTNSGQKNNIKMPDETEVAKRRLAYDEYKNKKNSRR